MDETHFENPVKRGFKYTLFVVILVALVLSFWQKDAILGYFSFREHGEARVVIYAKPGTKVSLVAENNVRDVVGRVGRDGKLTLVEKKIITGLRVLLEHPQYFPEEKSFDFVGQGEMATFHATMAPLLGSLQVKSFPEGAKVWVDDEEVGTTPWSKEGIRHGTEMFIQVSLEDFVKQSRQVKIVGGEREELLFNLRSTLCSITLVSPKPTFSFAGLKVYLDDELGTLDESEIKFVQPGKRMLRVISHDGLILRKVVNLKPGQHLKLALPDWFVEDES